LANDAAAVLIEAAQACPSSDSLSLNEKNEQCQLIAEEMVI